jgi:hypothetical protein
VFGNTKKITEKRINLISIFKSKCGKMWIGAFSAFLKSMISKCCIKRKGPPAKAPSFRHPAYYVSDFLSLTLSVYPIQAILIEKNL